MSENEKRMAAKWLGGSARAWRNLLRNSQPVVLSVEYTEDYYLTAASGYRDRAAREGCAWQQPDPVAPKKRGISQHGVSVALRQREVKTHDDSRLSGFRSFRAASIRMS